MERSHKEGLAAMGRQSILMRLHASLTQSWWLRIKSLHSDIIVCSRVVERNQVILQRNASSAEYES